MRKCCIPGCASQQTGKRSLFSLPKNEALLEQWCEVLPLLRTARASNRICHLHFQPSDVHSVFTHNIGGKIYLLERERTHLKANAVPSLNLPSGEMALQPIKHKKPRKVNEKSKKSDGMEEDDSEIPAVTTTTLEHSIPEEEEYAMVHSTNEITEQQNLDDDILSEEMDEEALNATHTEEPLTPLDGKLMFDSLFDDVYEVILPSTLWGMHHCPRRTFLMFVFMDVALLCAAKILIVDNTGKVKTYLASRLISEKLLPLDILTTELISELLNTLDLARICVGAEASEDCEVELKDDEKLCAGCLQKLTTK